MLSFKERYTGDADCGLQQASPALKPRKGPKPRTLVLVVVVVPPVDFLGNEKDENDAFFSSVGIEGALRPPVRPATGDVSLQVLAFAQSRSMHVPRAGPLALR